jgi:hypothetical protein
MSFGMWSGPLFSYAVSGKGVLPVRACCLRTDGLRWLPGPERSQWDQMHKDGEGGSTFEGLPGENGQVAFQALGGTLVHLR